MSQLGPQAEPMEAIVARLVARGATGCLEVNEDQKRWLLFFSSGALVFSRSNLKTEQVEAIREKAPDATQSELFRLQATRRLRNVLKANPTSQQFHDGQTPPQVTPVNVLRCLREALVQAHGAETLTLKAGRVLAEYPRVTGELSGLGLDAILEPYLQDVDGGRSGKDVVAFAPAPPEQVVATLWLLYLMGELELSPSRVRASTVQAAGGAGDDPFVDRPTGSYAAAGVPEAESESLDVGGLLADLIQTTPAAAAPKEPGADQPPREHPMAARLRTLGMQIRSGANHFEVLGRPWDSDPSDFRRAYTELARDLHPDRYHDAPDELREQATELFDTIRRAMEVLGNDAARSAYIDVVIHGKKTEEELAQEQLGAYWAADDAYKKGLTLYRNGRVREAYELFKQAAEAQPDELEFQAWFGYTSFATHRLSNPALADEGIARLRDVLDRNRSQERQLDFAWMLLGKAHRERGEFDAARKALIQALRINPSNDSAVREMRRLDAESGRVKKEKEPTDKKPGFFASLFGKK